MILFSINVVTSDNVDILFYVVTSQNANNIKIEFIIQYIDVSRLLAKKIIINNIFTSEELLCVYTDKISLLLNKINTRTLSSLFKFDR